MSRWLVTSAVAAVLASAGSAVLADDQPQPPSGQKPSSQQPSDIGRVSAGGRGEEQTVVKPNATTSRAAAIEEKKEAPNIVDVQPLSEIVKLPDINTAEALQRIPGISLETDSGEGRFVHIRGLDADLNGTTYGGVRLPASNASSPSGGQRAVAFDTFPTGIVGGIEVTKTLRPDMDAEGLGGTINLVPRTGAEHGGAPFVDLDIGGGIEPLRDTPVYHAEFSAGRSFDGGDGIGGLFAGKDAFSAVVSFVYHQDKRGIDDIEEDYDDAQDSGVPDRVLQDLQFRRYEYERRRYGAAANFDARATEYTSLYLRVLYSGYLESANKHYLVLNGLNANDGCSPLPSCIQDPNNPNGFTTGPGGGGLEQDTTDSLERIQNTVGIIGGSTVFPAFKLDYHASYALGTDNTSHDFGGTFTDPNGVTINYDNVTDSRFPRFTVGGGVNPANPANYVVDNIGVDPSLAHDDEVGAGIDLTIPIGSGNHLGEWKTGLSLRQRHKYSTAASFRFTPGDDQTFLLSQLTYGSPQIYYNDLYNIGPPISLPAVRGLVAANPQDLVQPNPVGNLAGDTDDHEDVYAAYVQYSQRFGKVGVLAGLRVEATRADYMGFVQDTSNTNRQDLSADIPSTVFNAYTNVFPTLQGRYDFTDHLVGRLTYSTGVARPGFQQITPGASYNLANPVDSGVQIGNPKLKPTLGQSVDADLEWYPGDGQIAALGLFYKHFDDYILMTEQRGVDFTTVEGTTFHNVTVDSFSNGPAHVEGVEGQWQQKLLFLPAPLQDFGYNLNFTYVDSFAQIHPGETNLLPSTSRLTWNAEVFYEQGPLVVRLAADYVGMNLFSFGDDVSTDIFSKARLTMDLGSSYAIAHGVKIYFDAKNLLNTPLAFTEGPNPTRYVQREFYDATFLLGVRVSF